MTIRLYAPIPPYTPITIRPGILRRLGLRTSPFATMGEIMTAYAHRPARTRHERRGT